MDMSRDFITPGHQSGFHLTTPSTGKVGFHPGTMPKVFPRGKCLRRSVYGSGFKIWAERLPLEAGGGLCPYTPVFKAHRLLYHSTLDLRVIKKKQ